MVKVRDWRLRKAELVTVTRICTRSKVSYPFERAQEGERDKKIGRIQVEISVLVDEDGHALRNRCV